MVRAEILTLLNELMGAYPYAPIKDPETTARMYELSLGEYEAKHVFMAARIHIRNNKYFPSPNHLIELIPKGRMLCEMEEEKAKALTAPKQEKLPAPDKRIAIKQDYRCPLHEGECVMMYGELCDGPEDGKCPFEGL